MRLQVLAEQLTRLGHALLASPDTRATGAQDDTSSPTAYECVLNELVPVLTSLLSGGPTSEYGLQAGAAAVSQQLADAASEALIELAQAIKPEDLGATVLRAVLMLAHDNEVEENRVVATTLLGSLAPILGSELCQQYVLPEVVALADDPAFRVRKAAALRIGAVATAVGSELAVQKLLPVFETLARDEIWGVRKASVESLGEVSAVMALDVRTGVLEKLMHEFHADSSRWVRIEACRALGPFIATLPAESISAPLLQLFTDLANPSSQASVDSDVAYSCAFNFPGVAKAVGAERWGEIAPSFATLVSNIQWKVRRTLSYALHDIATILGPELSEEQLLPTFDTFLLEDLDEVKVGVIQNLAVFFRALSPSMRLEKLPVIDQIRRDTDNWRFRHLLASQLAAFGEVLPREAALDSLLPLAFDLCTDYIAEVRIAAVGQVGQLLRLLIASADVADAADDPALAEGGQIATFLLHVVEMARGTTCFKRANCVQICTALLDGLPPAVGAARLLPPLLPLASDRVANVRLALAMLCKERLLYEGSPFAALQPEVVPAIIERLQSDRDRDVLRNAHANVDGYEPPRYACKPPYTPGRQLHPDQLMSMHQSAWGGQHTPGEDDEDAGRAARAIEALADEAVDENFEREYAEAMGTAGAGKGDGAEAAMGTDRNGYIDTPRVMIHGDGLADAMSGLSVDSGEVSGAESQP